MVRWKGILHWMTKTCWGIGLFTLPFNQWILLWQESSTQGLFNPYSSVGIYLSEFFLMAAGALSLLKPFQDHPIKASPRLQREIGIFSGLMGLSILFSENKIGTTAAALHMLTPLLILHAIAAGTVPFRWLRGTLLTSLTLQAGLGILQVGFQHSLGLGFLGESNLSPEIVGVAKVGWAGIPFLRAYGTFPHANILAGYLLMGIFLFLNSKNSKKAPLHEQIAMGLMMACFLLTGSQGALLAGVIGMFFLFSIKCTKKITTIGGLSLLVVAILSYPKLIRLESIQERWQLTKTSLNMLLHAPWGVGWHQFTARMQTFSTLKLQTWQFQPVHNIYLLLLNELGLLGVFLFRKMAIGFRTLRQNPWKLGLATSFAVIGLWDHYLLSLYQGWMLLAIVMGLLIQHTTTIGYSKSS